MLEQAELVLAAGWSREDEKKHGRKIIGHSLVGAVYATNASSGLKNEAVIFLNQCCADYAGIPRHTRLGPAVRYFNARLPRNDGKRQALLLMAEAVDAAKETLDK